MCLFGSLGKGKRTDQELIPIQAGSMIKFLTPEAPTGTSIVQGWELDAAVVCVTTARSVVAVHRRGQSDSCLDKEADSSDSTALQLQYTDRCPC